MKPVFVYVDDEPHNLTVFEAALPVEWDIHVFDNPLKAIEFCNGKEIWCVVSDQRMPSMMGVNFLEIIKKTNPFAQRALVTGYSDEDLIIESVRKAQVHDYIRKPWDVDDLEHRMRKLAETYAIENELRASNLALEKKNKELESLANDLRISQGKEEALRRELEAWAPPFVLPALTQAGLTFPLKKDLAIITFDIIGSSALHDLVVAGKPARSAILKAFSEIVIKHGGWRESSSGDSAYAHFGLFKEVDKPCDSSYAVASEFRVFLRNFNNQHGTQIESGIGLHFAKECLVEIHEVEIHSPFGKVIHKSFDSTSIEIDPLHRIEKLAHQLAGSNIVLTEEFVQNLSAQPFGLRPLGFATLKGQKKPSNLFLRASDMVTPEALLEFEKGFEKRTSDAA